MLRRVLFVLVLVIIFSQLGFSTNVSSCGDLDSAHTVYTLNQSISGSGQSCLNVTANNITIDFAGYRITGDSYGTDVEYGINITGFNNTTVVNGNITGFTRGIHADDTYFLNISGGRYNSNGPDNDNSNANYGYNVYLKRAYNFTVDNIVVNTPSGSSTSGYPYPFSYGLYVKRSLYGTITNVVGEATDSGGEFGIYFENSNFTILEYCDITNWMDGITLESSLSNIIRHTISSDNDGSITSTIGLGLELQSGSNKNNITNMTLNSNYGHGISIDSSKNNTLSNSSINLNDGGGGIRPALYIYSSSNSNNIINNIINSNQLDAISIDSSQDNNITNNTINSNGGTAATFSSVTTCTFENNTICYNGVGRSGGSLYIKNNTQCTELSTPANSTTSSNTTWEFFANVTNYINMGNYIGGAVKNCTFYIDGETQTNTTLVDNQFTRFNATLNSNGAYTWNVTCTDLNDNSGTSGNYLLILTGLAGDGASCTANADCSSGYCVHSSCRAVAYYCGDNYCDSRESCSSCASDCGVCGSGSLPTTTKKKVDKDNDLDAVLELIDTTIEKIKAGETVEIDISKISKEAKSKVRMIKIIAKEDADNAEVSVTGYATAPTKVKDTLTENGGIVAEDSLYGVYQYIEIEAEIEVESADIEFEVKQQWLANNGVTEEQVRLLHYDNGWKELETEVTDRDANNVYFVAKTDSFSVFAIGVDVGPVSNTELNNVLIILIGVISVIVVISGIFFYFPKK